jgi:hypothetical protein
VISYLFSSNATQSWSNKFLMSINGRGHEDKRELYWCSQRGCGFNEFIRIKIGVWLIQINIEHFHNPLSFINTRVFPFIFYDQNRSRVADHQRWTIDVDATANDVKITTFRSTIDRRSEKCWRVDDRIGIWLIQISWTVYLIYKWIILYFS